MPKVVCFRNQVFTNAHRNNKDDKFHVIHCAKCNTHLAITDMDLFDIPRRRTDNAVVIDFSTAIVKLNSEVAEESIAIRREKGIERQWKHSCKECQTPIGYQCVDPKKAELKLMYLKDSAIILPDVKKKTAFQCKTCGYMCNNQQLLDKHFAQKPNHEQLKAGEDMPDPNAPLQPIIVG
eukprot:GDKI01013855.1.p1 GENE.GDKI01013855.1~~GDKI01013855.1.p1  ORF type:complete len:179 (+),score=31.96 GDKI01013855.1:125-661(+)